MEKKRKKERGASILRRVFFLRVKKPRKLQNFKVYCQDVNS